MERFWEAHDFIIKAMTTHDENFNWEGEYFHYRQVNVWPRCHGDTGYRIRHAQNL